MGRHGPPPAVWRISRRVHVAAAAFAAAAVLAAVLAWWVAPDPKVAAGPSPVTAAPTRPTAHAEGPRRPWPTPAMPSIGALEPEPGPPAVADPRACRCAPRTAAPPQTSQAPAPTPTADVTTSTSSSGSAAGSTTSSSETETTTSSAAPTTTAEPLPTLPTDITLPETP